MQLSTYGAFLLELQDYGAGIYQKQTLFTRNREDTGEVLPEMRTKAQTLLLIFMNDRNVETSNMFESRNVVRSITTPYFAFFSRFILIF